jgi:hypothetical protein
LIRRHHEKGERVLGEENSKSEEEQKEEKETKEITHPRLP